MRVKEKLPTLVNEDGGGIRPIGPAMGAGPALALKHFQVFR